MFWILRIHVVASGFEFLVNLVLVPPKGSVFRGRLFLALHLTVLELELSWSRAREIVQLKEEIGELCTRGLNRVLRPVSHIAPCFGPGFKLIRGFERGASISVFLHNL